MDGRRRAARRLPFVHVRPEPEKRTTMSTNATDCPPSLRWRLEDLDLQAVDRRAVAGRDDIFLLACSASFIESGTDVYTRNLLEYFAGDHEFGAWLRQRWEPEELQHGRALRAYVEHVWPDFDWQAAFAEFFAEYSALCTLDELEPSRGRELVARCMVEMGTTTYYQALNALCDEPVLRDLTWRIRTDEVQHYKQFYQRFLRYRRSEGLGRAQVMAALWRRLAELRRSDADVALRHAAAWRWRESPAPPALHEVRQQVFERVRTEFPVELAVRMIIKPLQLGPRLQRWAQAPLSLLARRVLLH